MAWMGPITYCKALTLFQLFTLIGNSFIAQDIDKYIPCIYLKNFKNIYIVYAVVMKYQDKRVLYLKQNTWRNTHICCLVLFLIRDNT